MSEQSDLLQEAIERGYVIKQRGVNTAWKLYHAWCLIHAQPFVYVDVARGNRKVDSAAVAIDLFTTAGADGTGDRFTDEAMVEAHQLLDRYPIVSVSMHRMAFRTVSPVTIRHASVSHEQADELARALLALYRRMKGIGL